MLPLRSLWQEIADHFYPERADFTIWRPLGTDFSSNLMTSFPILCRRDMGNAFGTMLRPTAKAWFHLQRRHEKKSDSATHQYLQWFEETQRRAMYDPMSLFVKATKQGDHDFAGFGQCCLSVEMNKNHDGLLYRCWHLRDMTWQEDENGQIGFVARKWKPTAQTLYRTFGDRVHAKIKELNQKTPFEECEVYHFVCDADMYDDSPRGRPRWSIWYDAMHDTIMQADPIWNKHYVIPRWQTVSSAIYGTQYSFSPATVAALPDARLIQAMTYTLLEAGEKATSPPMVATQDAVRSDVALYAGGITWIDAEYDERLGEALRPLNQDFRGFEFGVNLIKDTRALISKAFFLDTLSMPPQGGGPEMTAYEVGQRVQEYIRNALPLFEPMEQEYNAGICDETFELLWRNGAFGDPRSWPRTLRGDAVDFVFESPLHDVIEQQKGDKFLQASKLVGIAIGMDPAAAQIPDASKALRDALTGIGVPSFWMHSETAVSDRQALQAKQQKAQQMLDSMEQGSNVVKNMGAAGLPAGGGAGGGGAPGGAAPAMLPAPKAPPVMAAPAGA